MGQNSQYQDFSTFPEDFSGKTEGIGVVINNSSTNMPNRSIDLTRCGHYESKAELLQDLVVEEDDRCSWRGYRLVLISPNYGCGWSLSRYDSRLVKAVLEESLQTEEDARNFGTAVLNMNMNRRGYLCRNMLALEVILVPIGVRFRVEEYDGSESVEILDLDSYEIA
eukprot:TRINITY_DN31491_c0_g2_i1.p1 TRINITY_DN31491_c0_g2~~TRINITY_DN31491_c0_g2_i1.p1  ORF type:complete len:167 (+),score=20.07 TRINITY_DN31491_c0_g2_i1:77-577(+)